jgi:superfamily II DNA or RNA helicase
MIDEKRDDIQNLATEAFLKLKELKGTANIATGTGKTFIFIKICKTLFGNKLLKIKPNILFLAETTQREIDLEADIKKFNKLYGFNLRKYVSLHFYCYQSAYKWKDTKWDLVCADEIHSGLTPEYSKFFFNNICDIILGLSATVDTSVKYKTSEGVEYTKGDLVNQIAPVFFKYSLNDAKDNNTTKELKIYVIDHHLDTHDKNITGGTKDAPFYTTERDSYDYWDNQFKKALFLPDGTAKTFRIRNTSAARAKLLYIAPSKVKVLTKLLTELKGKTLIFGNSIDALHQITPNVISSKQTALKNTQLRTDFDKGKINTLGSFKMLKQGANLKDLDNTIIHSYYSKELDIIQMLGRQRMSTKIGSVFILRTIGTAETKWYDKAMLNITNYEIIKCNGIEEAIKKYKENEILN